ncbi:hypothetical protein KM043_010610 [Ampulex compressa]|nr:hypothetical protein KM043_010610 [Ampulex compressa]
MEVPRRPDAPVLENCRGKRSARSRSGSRGPGEGLGLEGGWRGAGGRNKAEYEMKGETREAELQNTRRRRKENILSEMYRPECRCLSAGAEGRMLI